MKPTIDRFGAKHIPGAAALVAKRYAAMRKLIPALPSSYEDPELFASLLHKLDQRGIGVVALDGDRLVGFVTGIKIDSFRSFPTWFSPEWANGAAIGNSRAIYELLYAAVAELWQGEGPVGHLVLQFPFDEEAIDTWSRLGFGMAVGDGVRALDSDPVLDSNSLKPDIGGPRGDIVIRRATSIDREAIHALIQGLEAHLAAPPIYLRDHSFSTPEEVDEKLADRSQAVFVALCDEDTAGYMEIGPASNNASTIIRDPGTASITGAYIHPSFRRRDLGRELLVRAIDWAREEEYERCAVDFESMNIPGYAFWSRHFDLVCVGMFRVLCLGNGNRA